MEFRGQVRYGKKFRNETSRRHCEHRRHCERSAAISFADQIAAAG